MIVISYRIHFIWNIGKRYSHILCMYRKRLHLPSRMVWSTRNRHFCRDSWIIYHVRVPKCSLELADIDDFKQQSSCEKPLPKIFIKRHNNFQNCWSWRESMAIDFHWLKNFIGQTCHAISFGRIIIDRMSQ